MRLGPEVRVLFQIRLALLEPCLCSGVCSCIIIILAIVIRLLIRGDGGDEKGGGWRQHLAILVSIETVMFSFGLIGPGCTVVVCV